MMFNGRWVPMEVVNTIFLLWLIVIVIVVLVLAILGAIVAHGGMMGLMQSFGNMMEACRNMMATPP